MRFLTYSFLFAIASLQSAGASFEVRAERIVERKDGFVEIYKPHILAQDGSIVRYHGHEQLTCERLGYERIIMRALVKEGFFQELRVPVSQQLELLHKDQAGYYLYGCAENCSEDSASTFNVDEIQYCAKLPEKDGTRPTGYLGDEVKIVDYGEYVSIENPMRMETYYGYKALNVYFHNPDKSETSQLESYNQICKDYGYNAYRRPMFGKNVWDESMTLYKNLSYLPEAIQSALRNDETIIMIKGIGTSPVDSELLLGALQYGTWDNFISQIYCSTN